MGLSGPDIVDWTVHGGTLILALALAFLTSIALRRKEIIWSAAAAALSGALATFVVFYLFAFDRFLPLPAGGMVAASFIFWGGTYLAFLFGIIALKDIGEEQEYADPKGGHWFAWSGIILGILLPFFLGHAAVVNLGAAFPRAALNELEQKFQNWKPETDPAAAQHTGLGGAGAASPGSGGGVGTARDGYRVFSDLNFRFKIPDAPWVEFNFRSIDPASVLGFVRLKDELNLMITVNAVGAVNDQVIQAAPDLTVQLLKVQFPDMKLIAKKDWSINGVKGTTLQLEGTVMGIPIRYHWWIGFHGGFQYNLVFWNPQTRATRELNDAFSQLSSGFEILDSAKTAAGTAAADKFSGDYESPLYGYRMHVKNSRWMPWHTVREEMQWAEFGMIREEAGFLVLPAFFLGHELTLDQFARAVLQAINIDFQNIPTTSVKKFSENSYDGYVFDHERLVQGKKHFHKIRVLKNKDRGFLLATAQNLDESDRQVKVHEEAHRLFETVKKPKSIEKGGLQPMDRERAALVLNRVATDHYEKGNAEQAIPYLKSAVEIFPENKVIFENFIQVLSQAGRHEEVQKLLADNSSQLSGNASLVLHEARSLYEVGRKEESLKKFEQIVKSEPANIEAVTAYANLLLELEKRPDAEKLMDEALKKNPGSIDLRLAYVDFMARAGEMEKAIEEARKVHADYPSHDLARRTLFNLLTGSEDFEELILLSDQEIQAGRADYEAYLFQGLSQYQLNHYRDAHTSFQKAVRLNPGDLTAKRQLEELEKLLGYGNLDEVKDYLEPVKLPDGIRLDPAKAVHPTQDKSSYTVDETTAIHYQADQPLRSTNYRTIKVVQAADLRRFTEFEVRYDSMHEQVYVNKLEVKNEKGEVVGTADISKFYIVDDSDAGHASHDKILHVPVSGVAVGSTIEFIYSRQRKHPVPQMPYKELVFGGSLPVLREQVIVTGEVEDIAASALNGVRLKSEIGYRLWGMESIPAFKGESYLPDFDRFLPVLKLGPKNSNWILEGDEYMEMLKRILEESPQIKKLAEKLTEGLRNGDEKVEKIFQYMQDEYAYNAIEFGLRAMIPTEASKILSQKYGDCKDHSVLLYHLLRGAGIPAQLALARVDGVVNPEIPSLEQFNHMVVYVPSYSRSMILDATSKSLEPWIFPATLRNKKAFVLEDGASRLVDMVPGPDAKSRLFSERSIVLEGNDAVVSDVLTMTGYAAAGMREFFREIPQAGQLQEFQQSIFANTRYSLRSLRAENVAERTQPLKIYLEYHISNLMFFIREDMAGELPVLWEDFYLGMNPDPERIYPFEFSYREEIESRIHFRQPANLFLEAQNLPRDLHMEGGNIGMDGKLEILPDGFKLESVIRKGEGFFPSQEYAATQSKMKQMINALQLKLVLKPAAE